MSKLQSETINPVEKEFKKYLKIVDEKNTLRWANIEALSSDFLADYGEKAIAGINFGWYRVIKYKFKYEYHTFVKTRFRDGFKYEVYELITTDGDRETPPDQDEVWVCEGESGAKVFLELLMHMLGKILNDALMVEDFLEERQTLMPSKVSPFLVNLIWHDSKEQFTCEAESKDHAQEQANNAYPGCIINEVKELGEE